MKYKFRMTQVEIIRKSKRGNRRWPEAAPAKVAEVVSSVPDLLVALSVTMVLVDHIWSPSFSLRFQNAEPELLSLHRSSSTTFFLVALVKLFKFLPPAVAQPRTLMRAHEGPVFILFHTFHEQIRHPHRIEQIPSTLSHT